MCSPEEREYGEDDIHSGMWKSPNQAKYPSEMDVSDVKNEVEMQNMGENAG